MFVKIQCAKLTKFYLFYFWLPWVFIAVRTSSSLGKWGLLSSGSAWASQCGGFPVAEHGLWGTRASVVVVHGLSCPEGHGILPDKE